MYHETKPGVVCPLAELVRGMVQSLCCMSQTALGPVVQKPINANLRLKINQGVLFLYSQLLFNGDTGQNFTLEEVNLEIQEEATETFTQKLKTRNECLR